MREFTKEELNNEVWKDIPDYEGIYQISNLGRVMSIGRKKTRGDEYIPNKILKQTKDKNGYAQVNLSKQGKSKMCKTHRLTIKSFTYVSDLHVDHINGIRDDNRLENLRYCTNRENSTFYFINRNRTSSYIGVFKVSKNKWRASIRVEGKQYNLGNYSSELEASEVYQEALYNWENFKTIPDFKKIKDNTKVQGIYFNKKSCKWQATHKGKYIGVFKSKEDAIIAQKEFQKALDEYSNK